MWLLESLGVELKSGVVRAELRLRVVRMQAVLDHSFVKNRKMVAVDTTEGP
jgi:hypothetical protein